MNLYGSPKAGKSWLALGIAEAVSTGKSEFLGIPVRTHGRVCYLQVDTPRAEWTRRTNVVTKENYNLTNIYFGDRESGTPFPLNIITDWPILKKHLDLIQPKLLIIDTLRESFRGDENDSGVMQNVIAHFMMAVPPDCAVIFISHRRKETNLDTNNIMSSARGSNYISGRMDAVMHLMPKELQYQSRSIELTTLDVFQYPRSSGKSGMIHPNPEEARIMVSLEKIVRTCEDPDVLGNYSELGRRLHHALEGRLNKKNYSDPGSDAFRKQVERRMERVLYRISNALLL